MARPVTTATRTTQKKSPGRPSVETREKILRAAERLFASNGFDRVTLRQIARASDQGNVAAVQYHFGSKTGLLSAIISRHQNEIEERRAQMLAESESQGRSEDIETLFRILLEPLAEKLDRPSGRAYLRIQAQGFQNEAMRPATRTIVSRIGRSLGGFDDPETTPYRSRFAILLLFHSLADRAHQEESGRTTRADRIAFMTALGQALIGLFGPSAPD